MSFNFQLQALETCYTNPCQKLLDRYKIWELYATIFSMSLLFWVLFLPRVAYPLLHSKITRSS
jgi:hypothetical protein